LNAIPVGKVAVVALDSTSARDTLVAAARSQLGARYILGAERPGQAFDCSGLVRFVLAALRLDLPRTANEQAQRGVEVARDVSVLRPGDLLTFAKKGDRVTHIGVYVGEGRFVHASTSNRKVVEVSIEEPGTWFRRNWVGVRRLLAFAETSDTAATY
jgi:cell wall-associated NlpC family hydrolase